MAYFGQLILTNLGLQEQIKAQSGSELKFKRIAMGSGSFSGNTASLTALVKENVSVPISSGYVQNGAYTVEGLFSNEALQTGFEWREIGVYLEGADGNEILYCYANAGDAYDYIPATQDERYSKYIRVAMLVGNAENISFVENEGFIYVNMQSFNEAIQTINVAMDSKANADEHNIFTFTNLAQIGLTVGEETIESIALAMPNESLLVTATGQTNANIYPHGLYGLLEVSRFAKNRIVFRWTQKDSGADFVGSYTDGAWSGWRKNAVSFSDLSQIGVSKGSETIEGIATSLPDNSSVSYAVSSDSASIYPANYGLVTVNRIMASRIEFRFVSTSGTLYYGVYNSTASTVWSGWKKIYSEGNNPSATAPSATTSWKRL